MNDSQGRAVAMIWLALAAAGCTDVRAQGDTPRPRQVLPADVAWTGNPAIPPGGQIAVLAGRPAQAGLYTFRLRFPAGYQVMPHSHPEKRIYTVVEGTWYIGLGDRFDAAKLQGVPPGALYVVPAGTTHFHWARTGESVAQVSGVGPTATEYVDAAHDPRRQ